MNGNVKPLERLAACNGGGSRQSGSHQCARGLRLQLAIAGLVATMAVCAAASLETDNARRAPLGADCCIVRVVEAVNVSDVRDVGGAQHLYPGDEMHMPLRALLCIVNATALANATYMYYRHLCCVFFTPVYVPRPRPSRRRARNRR